MTNQPDIFTNVHKGIRRALFEVCVALGRAGDDERRLAEARALLGEVLHFVAHHGDNEDALLVPTLETRAPAIVERITAEHARIHGPLEALRERVDAASSAELYRRTCEFVGVYLEHMRVEEDELEPGIRAALSLDEQAAFGRDSVARTAPPDRPMMLRWMLPAMTRADAEGVLARLPPELAAELRAMI